MEIFEKFRTEFVKHINIKYLLIICFLFQTSNYVLCAQSENDILWIRKKVEKINTDSGYTYINLSNKDYVHLDMVEETSGLFKQNKLSKILNKTISIPQVNRLEYFFDDEKLIFVYWKVQFYPYDSIKNEYSIGSNLIDGGEFRIYVKDNKPINQEKVNFAEEIIKSGIEDAEILISKKRKNKL